VEGILSGGTEENRANVKKRKLFERQGYRGLRGGWGKAVNSQLPLQQNRH